MGTNDHITLERLFNICSGVDCVSVLSFFRSFVLLFFCSFRALSSLSGLLLLDTFGSEIAYNGAESTQTISTIQPPGGVMVGVP